jgi:hypothetical protein
MKITTTADGGVEIDFEATTPRRCGDCSLCCKLLPNVAFHKPANKPCAHQRHGKGCTIYAQRPEECQFWSCRWLASPAETPGMRRPDRAHYVIDALPDSIQLVNNETGEPLEFEAMQIWVDPAFPKTQHAPELRAYMLKMAEEHGWPTLLRWSNQTGTAVFPPPLNADGEWHEQTSECNTSFGRFSKLPAEWQASLDKSP